MTERTLALIAPKDGDAEKAFAGFRPYSGLFTRVVVFAGKDPAIQGAEYAEVPSETLGHETKARNFVNSFFRKAGYTGFLYVAAGAVSFSADPSSFFASLEAVMRGLDYGVWFSTVTDRCNFVYNKYNPTVEIGLDIPELKIDGFPDRLAFTSHSNTGLVVYDFGSRTQNAVDLDERFEIPMYFIIEFLARRRNRKNPGQLYFMNQYLTVPEEHGLFTVVQFEWRKFGREDFKREDALFKSMNVDYKPDNDADLMVETLYGRLRQAKGNT